MSTKIEWTDETWNPTTGCTKVSAGCKHCYAERLFPRVYPGRAFGDVVLHDDRLGQPLRWREPRMVFVDSMSDLFHEDVPEHFIADVWAVMAQASQHTFQVLTKRPERMLNWFMRVSLVGAPDELLEATKGMWPPPNVWLGVSVENQATADERIPLLLQTPAAVRFVSAEPMLGPVDLGLQAATCDCCERWRSRWVRLDFPVYPDVPLPRAGHASAGVYRAHSNQHGALSVETPTGLLGIKPNEFHVLPGLDWMICGGESGPGARPMNPDWARSLRDQCQAAGVPFFMKQWGEYRLSDGGYERVGKKAAGRKLDGREWNEMPEIGR